MSGLRGRKGLWKDQRVRRGIQRRVRDERRGLESGDPLFWLIREQEAKWLRMIAHSQSEMELSCTPGMHYRNEHIGKARAVVCVRCGFSKSYSATMPSNKRKDY